jgi:hypothetical protein
VIVPTWRSLLIILALAIGFPVASLGQLQPREVVVRWEVDPNGKVPTVAVSGLAPSALENLRKAEWPVEQWSSLLAVNVLVVDGKAASVPPMLGTYRVEGETLRFTPRYPLDRGRTYVATFRPERIPRVLGPDVIATYRVPKLERPPTVVTAVAPTAGVLPENLLKFYLSFSNPMSRGEVYDRVRLLREDGRAVDLPFLRLTEELWDPSGTRLTLLIDPGRIKRGLKPREENGPVLEAGRTYTLVVDAGWPDAEGDPLGSGFRKTFKAGPADEIQPDPKTWTIAPPAAMTRDPLVLTFPEPLDRALLGSTLDLVDSKGEPVSGHIEIEANETRWRFTPEAPWAAGDYRLEVDSELEDLAGNSIRRPFEVDIQRDTPTRPEATTIQLPIAIRPKP